MGKRALLADNAWVGAYQGYPGSRGSHQP